MRETMQRDSPAESTSRKTRTHTTVSEAQLMRKQLLIAETINSEHLTPQTIPFECGSVVVKTNPQIPLFPEKDSGSTVPNQIDLPEGRAVASFFSVKGIY